MQSFTDVHTYSAVRGEITALGETTTVDEAGRDLPHAGRRFSALTILDDESFRHVLPDARAYGELGASVAPGVRGAFYFIGATLFAAEVELPIPGIEPLEVDGGAEILLLARPRLKEASRRALPFLLFPPAGIAALASLLFRCTPRKPRAADLVIARARLKAMLEAPKLEAADAVSNDNRPVPGSAPDAPPDS